MMFSDEVTGYFKNEPVQILRVDTTYEYYYVIKGSNEIFMSGNDIEGKDISTLDNDSIIYKEKVDSLEQFETIVEVICPFCID